MHLPDPTRAAMRIARAALLCLFLSNTTPFAQTEFPLPIYEIYSVNDSIFVDGLPTEPAWQQAPVIDEFSYPWFEGGEKERTEVRMLWDRSYLYVFFTAYDAFISSHLTQRDDPVSRDDCVEVFIAPDTARVENYFNFEFNAITTILDRSPHMERSSRWNADGIKVANHIAGTLNDSSDVDDYWTIEVAIPLSVFEPFAPDSPPKQGQSWRLNLYRTGGDINLQYATWSNTLRPKPQFHAPDRFGIVTFSTTPVDLR